MTCPLGVYTPVHGFLEKRTAWVRPLDPSGALPPVLDLYVGALLPVLGLYVGALLPMLDLYVGALLPVLDLYVGALFPVLSLYVGALLPVILSPKRVLAYGFCVGARIPSAWILMGHYSQLFVAVKGCMHGSHTLRQKSG